MEMTTPMNYTEIAREILNKLERMETLQVKMAKQLEEMYFDEEPSDERSNVEQMERQRNNRNDDYDEEPIKRFGQKIAYNLIDDPVDVTYFKDFIYQAKTRFRLLNDTELKYVDIADKNFEDIRLSRKHLGILQTVYQRLNNKPWPFKLKPGYLYKYGDKLAWEWFEGT
jgi:hypothetical protein